MNNKDALEIEINQQYEQYRWIGSQQTIIFTLYSAIITATFAFFGITFNSTNNEIPNAVFGVILIVLGFMGLFISYALLHSRAMQLRTGWYLRELLIGMIDDSNTKYHVLKYKKLTRAGGFSLKNTIMIPILLSFMFATILFVIGIYTILDFKPINYCSILLCLMILILSNIIGFFILKKIHESNIKKINKKSKSIEEKKFENIEELSDYLRK